jgi:hypothetical protein
MEAMRSRFASSSSGAVMVADRLRSGYLLAVGVVSIGSWACAGTVYSIGSGVRALSGASPSGGVGGRAMTSGGGTLGMGTSGGSTSGSMFGPACGLCAGPMSGSSGMFMFKSCCGN